MLKPLFSKIDLDTEAGKKSEFYKIIEKELESHCVQQMKRFQQHGKTTCFQHCLNVAYYNYLLCKFFSLDYSSGARAGLLHDLFLYDWHKIKRTIKKNHAIIHPKLALKNAKKNFELNEIECDIIEKHMFPICFQLPKYKETIIIILVDKFCGFMETILRF